MQNTINNIRNSMLQARDSQGQPLYEAGEIRAVTDLLLDEVCGLSRVERILHPDHLLTSEQRETLLRIAVLLGQGIPVQQALGHAWFCGQRFEVTPDVLIPRPETEELVHWIADDARAAQAETRTTLPCPQQPFSAPFSLLDIGTGSGCIAISLARVINNSQVTAIDLSTAALDVARRNACQQCVDNVQFAQYDILSAVDNSVIAPSYTGLSTGYPEQCPQDCPQSFSTTYQQVANTSSAVINIDEMKFDVIVSNPPYICQCEAAEMSDIVKLHEPSMALFVPDTDPLCFYRAIGRYALTHLRPAGALYFEINAAYGPETCQLLRDLGFHDVLLRQDADGRDRMIRASLRPASSPQSTQQ